MDSPATFAYSTRRLQAAGRFSTACRSLSSTGTRAKSRAQIRHHPGAAAGQRNHAAGFDRRRPPPSPICRPMIRSFSSIRGGYVDQAKQSRDISEYAYRKGAAKPSRLSRLRTNLSRQPACLSPGACELHARARTDAPGRRQQGICHEAFPANPRQSFNNDRVGPAAHCALTGCGSGPAIPNPR